MTSRRWAVLVLVLGCNPGPAYRVPAAPLPAAAQYKEGAWKVAHPSDGIPRGAWWTMFGQPELDELEARLNINNQTIAQAFQNYLAARAQIRIARSEYVPNVTTNPAASWFRTSGTFQGGTSTVGTPVPPSAGTGMRAAPGSRITSYSLPAEISWAPDLFGRVKNSVRQSQYGAQMSAADLESTRLLAQATLAETYFQIRGQDALIEVLEGLVAANAEIVELTRARYEKGLDNELSVVDAELTLEDARVQLTTASLVRAQYEHAIATLIGVPATSFSMPRCALLVSPPSIPTGAPSQLLERRPDIAAAERQMASANAAIGVGYAAYFPLVTLTGNAGFLSSSLGELFSWPSRVWSLAGNLTQILLDGGRRGGAIDEAIAHYNADVAAYRQTVLVAFQQVEDYLAQTQILGIAFEQQNAAVAFALKGFELAKARYEKGLDPYLNVMTQQILLLAAQQALVTVRVEHMTGAVLLVQALGGGWDRSLLPSTSEVTQRPPAHARQIVR